MEWKKGRHEEGAQIKTNIRLRTMDVVEKIIFDYRRKLLVQYRKPKEVVCTVPGSGEEVELAINLFPSDKLLWLHEGMEIEEVGEDGQVIYVDLPMFGTYSITSVSPPQDSSSSRGVTLENGQRLKGAAFLKVGDIIKVRLDDLSYVECVKRA